MPDTVFIYALNCPITGRTRYVGKAKDPAKRLREHLSSAKHENNHRFNWLQSLRIVGQAPALEILDEVPKTEWQFWEREWIHLYRALGFDLTNGTDGGEGNNSPTLETRAKLRAARLGQKSSNETRAKLRAAKQNISDETRAKMGAANRGKKFTPEWLAKLRVARRRQKFSAETRAKLSASRLGKKRGPYKKKI